MRVRDIIPIGIALVVLGIVLSMGAKVEQDIKTDLTAGTYAYNITESSLQGLKTLGDWQDTIALVVAAVVIIGLVVAGFGRGTVE